MDNINLKRFTKSLTENLEPPVRKHLKNVYATVTLAILITAVGCYFQTLFTFIGVELLTILGTLGTLIWLIITPCNNNNNGKSQIKKKLIVFCVFAFLSGYNLGFLLQNANPVLIVQAFLVTSIVFVCFSLSALVAPRGHYLYLGGILTSALSILFWASIINLLFIDFKKFYYFNQAFLSSGAIVATGFIIFDTQNIIRKVRMGDKDYVNHAIDLFIDFIKLFRHLLRILINKEEWKNTKNNNNNKKKNEESCKC